MTSTESSTKNQQQPTTYDERVFNERIRQLFNSIDSASISHSSLPPNRDIGHMTSIVDALFPEQASLHQQQKQREQRNASTNDLSTTFDRFPLWSNSNSTNINNSSASAFCGGTVNGSSTFINRRQSKLHSSSRSLRNANYYYQQQQQQQQQQHHYRPPYLTRPRFTSSTIRLQSAATT